MRELPEELSATHYHTVTDGDTAAHWRNDLPVLATPVLLWLGEITAMAAVRGHLDDGEMTVGLSHDSSHLAPTPPGRTVHLTASLRKRTGRRLVFDVHAHDGVHDVLRGTHTRAVVDRAEFLTKLAG
jgi:predicted thioesterase